MKLVTISNKITAQKSRIGNVEADVLVQQGTHGFCRKGAFKRQEKDNEKALNKAKTQPIFGAAIMRRNIEINRKRKEEKERIERQKTMKAAKLARKA
jgi:hypothetical protein